jgi:hypothetical protein
VLNSFDCFDWLFLGVNQKLLLDYARLVAAGEWCHIYPEAGLLLFVVFLCKFLCLQFNYALGVWVWSVYYYS